MHRVAVLAAVLASSTVDGSPDIAVSPPEFSVELPSGATQDRTLTIANGGAADLHFRIATSAPAAARAEWRRARLAARGDRPTPGAAPAGNAKTAPGRYAPETPGSRRVRSPGDFRRTDAYAAGDLRIAILSGGVDIIEFQAHLQSFPDIELVDFLPTDTPPLEDLLAYDVTITAADGAVPDPLSSGNILADYVDAGGGVVLTLATFIDGGEIGGRFLAEGYHPFELGSGPIGSSVLGPFDAAHAIMAGVTGAEGELLGAVELAAGAALVAEWANGQPCVATGSHRVVAVNAYLGAGRWGGDLPLLLHNAALWASGSGFLSWSPDSGTVPSGSSVDVTATFDAEGMNAGVYEAAGLVRSDDPDEPTLSVPATLLVSGSGEVAVTPPSLDFGPTFRGSSPARPLTLSNPGADVLTVTSLSATPADYTVDPTSLTLRPGLSQVVTVTFAPGATGPIPGSLTIASDDPDDPLFTVPLAGEGVEPPVIAVSPTSLQQDLFTGDASTRTLTVSNQGAAPLEWAVEVDFVEASSAPRAVYGRADPASGEREDPARNEAEHNAPVALAGSYSGDLLGFGVTELGEIAPFQSPIGFASEHILVPSTISGYTVSYLVDGVPVTHVAGFYQPAGVTPVSYTERVVSSERVVVEIVTRTEDDLTEIGRTLTFERAERFVRIDTEVRNVSAATLGAVILKCYVDWDVDADRTGDDWWWSAPRNLIVANDVRWVGLASREAPALYDLDGWGDWAARTTLPSGADSLTSFDGLALLHFEPGDLAPGAAVSFQTVYAAGEDRAELERAVDRGILPRWVVVDPPSGSLPAGGSADLAVTFDATGLVGRDYTAGVRVASNDPLTPLVIVPATLHVTGVPGIEVAPLSVDFGPTFRGGSSARPLRVSNPGSDDLTVTGVATDPPDYAVDTETFVLRPGDWRVVTVTFAPATAGLIPGSLTIASDDPDEPSVVVALVGEGVDPPVIEVAPASLHEELFTGEVSARTLTISNPGAADLEWALDATFGESRVAGHPALPPGHAASRRADLDPLEDVLAALDAGFATVTAAIPDRFDFTEGTAGSSILDGGLDMYDGGNLIQTNWGGPLRYSDGVIFPHHWGRYFTRKYPGLWVFAADLGSVSTFTIYGGLGADGAGSADAAILDATVSWVPYRGFVKRVYGAGVPSVNHLVIVGSDPGVTHSFSEDTDSDLHQVFGLDGVTRMYALVYAGVDGVRIDDAATRGIMEAFVSVVGPAPPWVDVAPKSGTIPGGGATELAVSFDARGLPAGDLLAGLLAASNDPLTPLVTIPVALRVADAPAVQVAPGALDFGDVHLGSSATRELTVTNIGTDPLSVTGITSDDEAFAASPVSFDLAPGGAQMVTVTFEPVAVALHSASLTLTHSAPSGTTVVPLAGAGVGPPALRIDPLVVEAVTPPGGAAVRTFRIHNDGGSALEWSVTRRPGAVAWATAAASASRPLRGGPPALTARVRSDDAPPGYAPATTAGPARSEGATTLLVQDVAPWGSAANEALLAAHGIAFDVIPSTALAATDLMAYRVVLVPGDQWSITYQRIAAAQAQVADFVAAGGVLQFHGAGWGWNGGNASLVPLPGGVSIVRASASTNDVVLPGHRLVRGVPDPFTGDSASHAAFAGVPASATRIVRNPAGQATLIEYAHGNGWVVASGQVLEYAYGAGEPAGTILANMPSHVRERTGFWLSASPPSGVVFPGGLAEIVVTFDAGPLDEGSYTAEFRVAGNAPATPVKTVRADLVVASTTDGSARFSPGTINEGGAGDWLHARVTLPPGCDVGDVVLETVRCQGVVPAVADSASVGTELSVKFDRAAVQATVPEADEVAVIITGDIRDSTGFIARGTVRVLRPRIVTPNGGEALEAGSPTGISWEVPSGFPADHADVFYATDGGAAGGWTAIARGLHGTSCAWTVPDVAATDARVRVILFDATGIRAEDTSDEGFTVLGTGTGVPTNAAVPARHALRQNVPNPFARTATTEIRFDLPDPSPVALRIYDVSGRLVRVLVDAAEMPAGTHAIRWNGADAAGRPAAAGIYFYRLQAREYQATRRMIRLP